MNPSRKARSALLAVLGELAGAAASFIILVGLVRLLLWVGLSVEWALGVLGVGALGLGFSKHWVQSAAPSRWPPAPPARRGSFSKHWVQSAAPSLESRVSGFPFTCREVEVVREEALLYYRMEVLRRLEGLHAEARGEVAGALWGALEAATAVPQRFAACVLVEDGEGRVLAVERPGRPGLLCLPGGKVEAGESVLAAAEAEAEEEAGVRVRAELPPVVVEEGEGGYLCVVFRARILEGTPQGKGVRWVRPEEVNFGAGRELLRQRAGGR